MNVDERRFSSRLDRSGGGLKKDVTISFLGTLKGKVGVRMHSCRVMMRMVENSSLNSKDREAVAKNLQKVMDGSVGEWDIVSKMMSYVESSEKNEF